MSEAETEKHLAKKLIKKEFITQEQAKKALSVQRAYLKKEKVVSLYKILKKQEVLDDDSIKEAKKALKVSTKPIVHKKADKEDPQENTSQTKEKKEKNADSESETVTSFAGSKNCPECNSTVDINAQECNVCAAVIPVIITIQCSVCHNSSPSSSKTCHYCHCSLETGKPTKATKTCKPCKAVLLTEDAICPNCGSRAKKNVNEISPIMATITIIFITLCVNSGFGYVIHRFQGQVDYSQPQPLKVEKDFYDLIEPTNLDGFVFAEYGDEQKKLMDEVLIQLKKGNWNDAKKILDKNISIMDFNLLAVYAFNLYTNEQKDRVISLHKAYPKQKYIQLLSAEILFQKAMQSFKENNFLDANKIMKRCLSLNPSNSEYYFWAGIFAYGDRKVENSQKYFELCLKQNSPWPEANLFLHILKRNKQPAQSQQHLDTFKKEEVYDFYQALFP